jgi:hypothetical protein
MPVDVDWDDERKIAIRFELSGRWTWDEFYPAYDKAHTLMDTVDYPVALIFHPDRIAAVHYPSDMASNTRTLDKHRHPRMGLSLTVTDNAGAVIRAMVKAASVFLPKDRQTQFVNSLEEARAIVSAQHAQKRQQTREHD